MKFRSLFIAHTPGADKEEHHVKLETDKYLLRVNLVKNQDEALEVAKDMAKNEGIQSIILCPGFTHQNVAEISQALDGVGVTVARGDGPSSRIAKEAMEKAGWFD
ncbi:MAG: DUF6506 family protein [Candidatus Saliniplasma sp.]